VSLIDRPDSLANLSTHALSAATPHMAAICLRRSVARRLPPLRAGSGSPVAGMVAPIVPSVTAAEARKPLSTTIRLSEEFEQG